MTDRVIVLVDMDCFYCQVEAKLNPSLAGKPVAVVQYNAWKGGGIIAVNYEARDKGVTRGMRGDDAKKHCPDIELVSVPTVRDKADLTKYRDASRDVIAVLCTYSDCVERASIDEAYIDLTETIKQKHQEERIESFQISNTFVVGYSKDKCNDEAERQTGTSEWLNDIYYSGLNDEASKNLAVAANIVEKIRCDVYNTTGFRCSAGIAHNKILAKLSCGLHKPNRQTVLPHSSVPHLYKTLSVKKVRHLGGKLGDLVMETLNCNVMADLFQYSEKQLKAKFDEKTGSWLYNIARGIDSEQVKARLVPKSIGCCKRFPGKTALKGKDDITYWLDKLTEELTERILEDQTMNKRKAQLLTVSMTLARHQATSKSISLTSYDKNKIYTSAYSAIKKIVSDPKEESWLPIFCLGLSASKFMDFHASGGISSFFQPSTVEKSNSTVNKSCQPRPTDGNASALLDGMSSSRHSATVEKSSSVLLSGISSFFQPCVNERIESTVASSCQLSPADGISGSSFLQSAIKKRDSSESEIKQDVSERSLADSKSFFIKFFNKQIPSTSLEKGCDEISKACNKLVNNSSEVVKNYSSEDDRSNVSNDPELNSFPSVKESLNVPSSAGSHENSFDGSLKIHKNSFEQYFTKQNSSKSDNLDETAKTSKTATKNRVNSIDRLFKNQTEKKENELINPLDVFPDLSIIDDEMLQSFPLSFRKKVKELKKIEEAKVVESENDFKSLSNTLVNESSSNCVKDNSNEEIDRINNSLDKPSEPPKPYDCDDIFENYDELTNDSEPPEYTSKYFPTIKEVCPQCGDEIDEIKFSEHLDYHVAEQISKDINSVPNPLNIVSVNSTNFSSNPSKRKQSGRGGKLTQSKKFKTIKTFFGS